MRPEVLDLKHSATSRYFRQDAKKYADNVFGRLASHRYFEGTTMVVILLNALCIGIEADYSARFYKPTKLYEGYKLSRYKFMTAGVVAAKTHQDLIEGIPDVRKVVDDRILDDEVLTKQREISQLKAEIAQTKEILRKKEEEMKKVKSEAFSAAQDARRIVLEHEKEKEPIHSLPGNQREVRTVPSRSVASARLVKDQASKQVAEGDQRAVSGNESAEKATKATATKVTTVTKNHSNHSEANISVSHSNVSAVRYGSEACPCIGFDNLEGEALTLIDGKMVKYPADLGSSCDTWDDGVHPQCAESEKGKWCGQPWCYVDPRQCKLDVLPTMSTYMPTARYKHMPLFYSYSTCGSSWGQEAQVAVMGNGGCRCVGVNNMPGSLKFDIDQDNVLYPAEAGGSCDAWDLDNHPQCTVNGSKPEWCNRKWCFVDPCSCSVSQPPKVSTYLNGTMQGKSIYYSYETCGNEDMFTATYAKAVCVLEKTKDTYNKNPKCLWSGDSCLGKELVDKDACLAKTAQEAQTSEEEERSFAASLASQAATLAVLSWLL